MSDADDTAFARDVLETSRYVTLATSDGSAPWIAPIEPMRDGDGTFYFFSTEDSRHARHIATNPNVAISLFNGEQPAYASDANARLRGLQIEATARKLDPAEYPDAVKGAIEALDIGGLMPPYAVYRVDPTRYYLPKLENGVKVRTEVDL